MSEALMLPLEELMAKRTGSVDPSRFPDEQFDLYSIPAFDKGCHEVVAGSEIGSTKQVVEPNDVLLSKIVPHIRRSWVVGQNNGRRMIASGEWIVFRSSRADPAYLRHVLVGNPFHAQFMQTVSGVGGSLLRARPAQVGKIKIPLPPLPEQRRIAAILDQADALRAKRREALTQLDSLTQSIFMEMFGDPVKNPNDYSLTPLKSLVDSNRGITYGIVQRGEDCDNGVPVLRISDVIDGEIQLEKLKRTSHAVSEKYSRTILKGGELVISIRGTVGRCAIVPPSLSGGNISREVALIPIQNPELSWFLLTLLRNPSVQRRLAEDVKGVAQSGINLEDLRELGVIQPSQAEIQEFTARLAVQQGVMRKHRQYISEIEGLFASLQHHAFRGEL